MSTDFRHGAFSRRIINIVQRNMISMKNLIDACWRMELLSRRQSGVIALAASEIMGGFVLIDGDKIQFASRTIAVQDCFAEAEKLGVRSLF